MSAVADDVEVAEIRMDPEELRDAATRLLADQVDRRLAYSGDGQQFPGTLHDAMAGLGWMLLPVPEGAGGLGQGFDVLAPVYEELGRALAPVSIADSLATAELIAQVDPSQTELLEQIGSGKARFVVSFDNAVEAVEGRISTVVDMVMDPLNATHLLLMDGQAGALVVALDEGTVEREQFETWDRTRRLGRIVLKGASVLTSLQVSVTAAQGVKAHLDLAIAWDGLGGAAQALAESVAYMQTRHQFGRPIGSFQALKHRAADLKVGLEIAAALTRRATSDFVERSGDWSAMAAQAKLLVSDAYRNIAEENVQFHGGIGFTWEHDAHIFLKRAWLNDALGGTADAYRDRIAASILRAPPASEAN